MTQIRKKEQTSKMNTKNLLITSGIIALSLLNVSNVQAETAEHLENTEIKEEVIHNTDETTSETPTTDNHPQTEAFGEESANKHDKYDAMIEELNTLLNDTQKEALEEIRLSEEGIISIFERALIAHDSEEFADASDLYTEVMNALPENSSEKPLKLLEVFNELAIEQIHLLDYEYEVDELNLDSEDATQEDSVEKDEQKSNSETEKELVPEDAKESNTKDAQEAIEEDKREANSESEENSESDVETSPRIATFNAPSSEKTVGDYYNQILNSKSVSEAWNLAQEFKEEFPGDAFLEEAVNHAAQINLDYGIKLHERGEYADAASYYERVASEELAADNLISTAQAYLSQASSDKELTTPAEYYEQIKKAKGISGAWNLVQEFKTNFPGDELLEEAVNYVAQLNLDYGMKLHDRGEYADAASYYERVTGEELAADNLVSTAQAYLSQASSDKDLTTPADYYEQIKSAKGISGAWNLVQEFKTNFPGDELLEEAVNYVAQLNLDYGMKLHDRGEYADAASYYERVTGEELATDSLVSTAQAYLSQASSDKDLTSPADYYDQIQNAKAVSGAWSLAQEFKANFPTNDLLEEAMDYAAQLHLNYAMKLHDQGELADAIPYYDRILKEDVVSDSLKATTQIYLDQANSDQDLTTPADYYEQIVEAKSVSGAWSLAEKFNRDFPQSALLPEALNHAAQLNLDYGMKLHGREEYADAAVYYDRVLSKDLVSDTLKSTAQVYLDQANAAQTLTTPKDYYEQVLSAKGVSGAWSLAQEFKANFPHDALLEEAINYAAEVNFQYATKLHDGKNYSQANEYYKRIMDEDLVNASTKDMAQTFSKLAEQGKTVPSANNYASQVTSAKSASGAWNLAQEALLIYPGHSGLIDALNKTANDNLTYGRKLHKQGSEDLAKPYYEKVSNDTRINAQIRHLADVFLQQTAANHQPVVYLDSGHGGSDSGASFYGANEKHLNQQVTNYLKSELESRGYSVILSRGSDVFVPLTDRAVEANNLDADVFVSIHHNSMGGSGTARGIETFFFHKVASGFGQEVNRNNFNWDDPRISESVNLADEIQANLIESTGLLNRGVKGNNFNVLRNTHIPAVLLELGFMDNASEAAIISSSSYQKTAASAIADGIDNYFSTINK